MRRSALHDAFASAEAVFGAPARWERPLWFARDESESRVRYSYGAQAWWPAAEREAVAVRDGVALLELTPFTKIDVRGPDALALHQTSVYRRDRHRPGPCGLHILCSTRAAAWKRT